MLDISKLAKVCSIRKLGSQAIVFEEGDPGAEMFIILFGRVSVLISAPNGTKVEIAQLKAGDTFGEMSLLEGLHRSATVQVLEEATIVAVNESNFEAVICQEPALALRIMKSLSERVRRQNTELTKYKDQLGLISQPTDIGSSTTISEIEEEHKLDISECDDFSKLVQYMGKYNKMTPNHSEYLFDKKVLCPACGQTVTVKLFRSSKLRLKQIDPDYRKVYTNFDPLWYIVWVCPDCYYADFGTDFLNISDREREQIMNSTSKVMDTFGALPNGPVSLTQVFTGYYLMLYWFQQLKTPSPDYEKIGKIWLRLSWLYHDVQEVEMSLVATRKALEYFLKLLNDMAARTTPSQDQYLYLLVGELSLKMGNMEEARNYFHRSILLKGGNEQMKQQAQNRIQELKSLV